MINNLVLFMLDNSSKTCIFVNIGPWISCMSKIALFYIIILLVIRRDFCY